MVLSVVGSWLVSAWGGRPTLRRSRPPGMRVQVGLGSFVHPASGLLKAEPCQEVLVARLVGEGVGLVPVSEQVTDGAAAVVCKLSDQGLNLLAMLAIEGGGVGVVDEAWHHAGLAAVLQ